MTIIILCGGKGSRLRPVTDSLPKPLVPLSGKPILQHIIEHHIRKGARRFVLCLGYRAGMIRDFIESAGFDAAFEFSDLGEEASMLARLHGARRLIGERAFVTYGDTLVNVDMQRMLERHQSSGAALTLTTALVRSPFGLIRAGEDDRVLAFEEKPVQIFYIGQMLLDCALLEGLDARYLDLPDGEGLVRLIQDLSAAGRVWMFPYSGPQITFNTKRELQKAEEDIINFYTNPE